MTYFAVLLSITVLSILVGWMFGRNQIDPDTDEGMIYYDS
jgi:hypothetical protein